MLTFFDFAGICAAAAAAAAVAIRFLNRFFHYVAAAASTAAILFSGDDGSPRPDHDAGPARVINLPFWRNPVSRNFHGAEHTPRGQLDSVSSCEPDWTAEVLGVLGGTF